ncbi:hypothetical protein AVEN_220688-1 [Araneus ventricosus]|uniref:Uncharacterized protein n=1 Tax=Araneus ventricosus TaxID=182803 RepID=A0A4Y2T738_ARAVE|nr:hypothetical protein AVEN_220688-1 [Araneus ventricosus]
MRNTEGRYKISRLNKRSIKCRTVHQRDTIPAEMLSACEVVRSSNEISHEKVTRPPSSLAESGRRKGPTPTKPFPRLRHPGGSSFETRRCPTSSGHTNRQENALSTPRANAIEELKTEFCHWEKRSPFRQMKS